MKKFNNINNIDYVYNLYKDGEYPKALDITMEMLKSSPNDFQLVKLLGLIKYKLGDINAAVFLVNKAVEINPEFSGNWFDLGNMMCELKSYDIGIKYIKKATQMDPEVSIYRERLGFYYYQLGNIESAKEEFERAIEINPENPFVIQHLNAINENNHNDSQLSEYAKGLFDHYAENFDQHLLGNLEYKTPFEIVENIKSIDNFTPQKILDLGCGTGLFGKAIKEVFKDAELVGVDISEKMLDIARKTGLYNKLKSMDINKYISRGSKDFDLVVASDVLLYIGDLGNVFSNLSKILSENGYFIFSVEKGDDVYPFGIRKTLRYAHSKKYIEELSEKYGYKIEKLIETNIRKDLDGWVEGYIFFIKLKLT